MLKHIVCEQNSGNTKSRCKVILFLCACKTGQQHYHFTESLRPKLGQFLPLCWWDVTTKHCTLALAVQQLHGLCWPPAPRPGKSAWFNLTFKSKHNLNYKKGTHYSICQVNARGYTGRSPQNVSNSHAWPLPYGSAPFLGL